MVIGFLLPRTRKKDLTLGIGFGVLLEEWPVLLSDLGFNTLHLYHTKVDFLIVFAIIGVVYLLFLRLAKTNIFDF